MSVYLHYGQDDLNKQYDQGSLVTDPSPWFGAMRRSFGESERDVFLPRERRLR